MKFQSKFLDRLNDGVVVFDGATGTQIQAAELSQSDFVLNAATHFPSLVNQTAERLGGVVLDGCNEILSLTRPDVIDAIHARYFMAGSDIVETNTFGCTAIVLSEYDIPELTYDLSLAASRIARGCADRHSTPDRPRFVAGGLGPGTKLISLGQATWAEIEKTYTEAAIGMIEGGVDVLLIETMQDLLLVKACIVATKNAMAQTGIKVPVMVQVTMEQTGTMLLGSDFGAALNAIECHPEVIAVGMNCATGPVEMSPHVRFLSQNSTRPISVQPNAGLPQMEGGKAVYKLTPEQLAEHHSRFIDEFGAALVGGCCGTTPDHTRAVAEAVGGRKHTSNAHWMKVRDQFPGFDFDVKEPAQSDAFALAGCSSLYQFVPYRQDNSFLIVGEKTNANGSKAFREMLAHENWEGLTELARELEGEGSHVLDVCTAFVGRDEIRDMRTLLGRYNQHLQAPIMIDSTEVPVIEVALQSLAGKPLINSINYEDGDARTQRVLALCQRYGAGVVGLTIDEDGMAKTMAKKVEIAGRLIRDCRAAGLADHDIFIDCLTFTLGSGDEEFRASAIETIEAIRQLSTDYPRVNTILGVSNVSFGLKPAARQIVNSAFLHFCTEVGLTSAIVHFSKILPWNKIDPDIWKIATDLVHDKREFAAAQN